MFEEVVDHNDGKPFEKSSDQIGFKEELEAADRILADEEFAERFIVSASKLLFAC
jgi:hypothetical protein